MENKLTNNVLNAAQKVEAALAEEFLFDRLEGLSAAQADISKNLDQHRGRAERMSHNLGSAIFTASGMLTAAFSAVTAVVGSAAPTGQAVQVLLVGGMTGVAAMMAGAGIAMSPTARKFFAKRYNNEFASEIQGLQQAKERAETAREDLLVKAENMSRDELAGLAKLDRLVSSYDRIQTRMIDVLFENSEPALEQQKAPAP